MTRSLRSLLPILILLLFSPVVWGAAPELKITGPSTGVPGDIVILHAETDADWVGWRVDTSDVQVPPEAEIHQSLRRQVEYLQAVGFQVEDPAELLSSPLRLLWIEDGKTLYLSSYPGTYQITLAAHAGEEIAFEDWAVSISGSPEPDPPEPPDPPDPPLDDLGRAVETAVRPLIDDLTSKVSYGALAQVYESIADGCEQGHYQTPDAVLNDLQAKTRTVLGPLNSEWTPVADSVVAVYLNDLNIRQDSYPSVYSAPFRSVASGLLAAIR